jgi:hypothetical protein
MKGKLEFKSYILRVHLEYKTISLKIPIKKDILKEEIIFFN